MIVPLDKPSGLTSADCVRRLGRAAGLKAGHAGTLDPGATGLLVVCFGESRKLVSILSGHDKLYRATLRLGETTDTLDAWGRVVEERSVPHLDRESVTRAARHFEGRINQSVPAYSAVKRGGRSLHELARRGDDVQAPEREVVIHNIEIATIEGNDVELEVSCGSGTYIRSLGRDIALELGTVGHIASLRRLACGSMRVDGAVGLDELLEAAREGRIEPHALPHARALEGQRLFEADEAAAEALRAGRFVDTEHLEERARGAEPAVVLGPDGRAVAIVRIEGTRMRPRRVLL